MANPLLDFVMSVVRDPDVAAQYAADPGQAIHDANLTGVTSADVNALIPVVADSLSMGMPTHGVDALAGDPAGNVWTSGAATAAFDAFDDHLSTPVIDDPGANLHDVVSNVIEQPAESLHSGLDAIDDHGVPAVADFADDPSTHLVSGIIDDAPLVGDVADADNTWHHSSDHVVENHLQLDPGFDIFD